MKPAIDLTQTHKTWVRGDITVHATWFGDELRPCIVLVPTHRRRGFKPAVITVDDAHLWCVETASPFYVQQQTPKIAEAIGITPTPANLARIANLIDDLTSELLTIPPKPAERVVVADAFLTDQDGKERHIEVKDAI